MDGLKRVSELAKALSDAGRIAIVLALDAAGELCVCQLVDLLELSFPTVSRHVAILERAELVEMERRGRWTYCRLSSSKRASSSVSWLRQYISKGEVKEVLKRVKMCVECANSSKPRRSGI